MSKLARIAKGITQAGMVAILTGAAAGVAASPAVAANYGNEVNNCYGIYWNTDWNQNCDWEHGAAQNGNYKTVADCTAPEISDKSLTIYRHQGDTTSYDGVDCIFGIHSATTWFW